MDGEVRVMTLVLRQVRDPVDEGHGGPEILELETAGQSRRVFLEEPTRSGGQHFLRLLRRNRSDAPAAGHASLRGEVLALHECILSRAALASKPRRVEVRAGLTMGRGSTIIQPFPDDWEVVQW